MDVTATLRQARQARGCTLDDLARETRIPFEALAAIDAGQFQRLPGGVYARAWIRTYAAAVGVDPVAALDAVASALPRVDESLADICRIREPARHPPGVWRYGAAVIADALVVLALNALIWAVSLPMCECADPAIPPGAFPAVAALLATTLMFYVSLFAGVSGRTAGAVLFGLEILPKPPRPLTMCAIRRRSASYLLADLDVFAKLPGRIGERGAEWEGAQAPR